MTKRFGQSGWAFLTWITLAATPAHSADPPDAFQIHYFSNITFGQSVANFTNSGASSTDAGAGGGAQNGDICANIYSYSPDEQLVACCACNITPNGLVSMQIQTDIGGLTLTPIIPSALVVKVLATAGGSSCTAASPAMVTRDKLVPGLLAWGINVHPLPVTIGAPATTMGITESPFAIPSALSNSELSRMTQLCAFIRANGSGYGICKSCRQGGLGAAAK